MRVPQVPIPFPFRGISEEYAFDAQEGGTTREALNVRPRDPKTGRRRGAQRSGLSRFLNDRTIASTPIQDIVSVPQAVDGLTWTTDSDPDEIFAKALPQKEIGVDIARDAFGCIYVAQQYQGVAKYNADGELLTEISIPDPEEPAGGSVLDIAFVHVDDFANVYIGTAEGNAAPTAAEQTAARLFAFEKQADGSYLLAWSLNSGNFFPDAVTHRKADGSIDLICLENDYADGDVFLTIYPSFDFFSPPSEDIGRRVTVENGTSGSGALMGRRLAKRDDGVVYAAMCSNDSSATVQEVSKVNMYAANDASALVWKGSDTLASTFGIGWGIAVGPRNSDGDWTLYCCGNQTANTNALARRFTDTGTATSIATDAWSQTVSTTEYAENAGPGPRRLRLAVDSEDNVYVPTSTGEATDDIKIYASNGTQLNHFDLPSMGDTPLGVALPLSKPQGMIDAGIEEEEHVFVVGSLGSSSESFFKASMVTVTQPASSTSRPARTLTFLSVAGGTIEKFSQGGSFSTPTGGSGALDSDAAYVESAVVMFPYDSDRPDRSRLRVLYTDGNNLKKYDPNDDAVTDYVSTGIGTIPKRCRFVNVYQGRAVLARTPENPSAWFMSRIGDPGNFDFLPDNPSTADAVSGITSSAGDCPDIITSLCPISDDLLLFGCDHSIYVLRGNPLQGGSFDLITDQHGMAYGRPWCKNASGQAIFYMDNQCGVHFLARGQAPVRITQEHIEERLRSSINFSTHFVRLVWNRRDEGLHIFQCPLYSDASGWTTTSVKHWFLDQKDGGWWEDQFGTSTDTSVQPTQVYLADGDAPDDRVLLLGCEDRRIRAWDPDAVSDDNSAATDIGTGSGDDVAIDSYVTIGPIQPRDDLYLTRFQNLQAWFASEQDGVGFEWFANEAPDVALDFGPVHQGVLSPGRNSIRPARFRAEAAYLRIRNASAIQRWAIEKLTVGAARAEAKKAR